MLTDPTVFVLKASLSSYVDFLYSVNKTSAKFAHQSNKCLPLQINLCPSNSAKAKMVSAYIRLPVRVSTDEVILLNIKLKRKTNIWLVFHLSLE